MENTFIPMGFQYYRAPTPAPTEWEKDLAKLAADGYNTVKLWLQWRWNEPEEDVYDFSDIDELMRLCEKYGLKAVLNLILDVTPVRLIKKYPDSAMITASGQRLEGYTTSYRQIGGVPGPCFHHPEARKHKIDFIHACAKHYADHPALLMWDVWNEPELTVGVFREPITENLVCYCDHSIAAFRLWLSERYGTIAQLNACWGRNYRSFDDAEAPRHQGTTADMIDWREFFCDTVTADYILRVDTIKSCDHIHPVMCHTVPMPIFNSITCCSDDFAIGAYGDMIGNSIGSDPMAADLLKSAARGKTMINSEIHAAFGSALNGFHYPDENDLIRHIFLPLAHGSRGFLFWQYRPELLGNEAPAWGHAAFDGGDTEWNRITRDMFAKLKKHERAVANSIPARREVAVYVDRANEIYAWDATNSTELTAKSMAGAYQMLYRNNYAVDFLCASDLDSGIPSEYRAVYFPAVFLFDQSKKDRVMEYVKNGGTVIIEALFGAVDKITGRHCMNLPGCGMAEILGKHIDRMYSTTGISNGYDGKVSNDGRWFEAVTENGEQLLGGRYFTTYTGNEGEILARTDIGRPVVSVYHIGKGRIIDIATLLSYGFIHTGVLGNLTFLRRLIGDPERFADMPIGVRVDRVGDHDEGFLVIDNTTGAPQTFTLPKEYCIDSILGEITADGLVLTISAGRTAVIEYSAAQ
ncbi:MAG: beta-galactosidase [Clostridia bacterium]|nr:beta-galactosidase [Clostridia bacterium]